MSETHLVKAVNVIKHFGHNEVLKGVDPTVDRGEVVCLLGPSGSGKTTFLRLINQMETLTGGRIWVDGELIGIEERKGKLHVRKDTDIARQRSRIGMVFQRFNLFPHMTALGNVIEAPTKVKKIGKAEATAEAMNSNASIVSGSSGRDPDRAAVGSRPARTRKTRSSRARSAISAIAGCACPSSGGTSTRTERANSAS